MTGRRRYRGKPLRVIGRVQRSAAYFEDQLRRTTDIGHQMTVALGYLKAALKRAGVEMTRQSGEQTIRTLVDEARRVDAATVASSRRAKELEASR